MSPYIFGSEEPAPLRPGLGFDDAYGASRGRLLLQLYAYCGDADAADDALTEAFIGASRRWRRLEQTGAAEAWLRARAIKRLDARPRPLTAVSLPLPPGGAENARLLATLKALDPVTRRLLIVRRLDGADLPTATDEVGLSEAAGEQALARATTVLHSAGIDATPAGLTARLAQLATDLAGRQATPARSLRRAGTRRRYAKTVVVILGCLALLAVGIEAVDVVGAWRPFAGAPTAVRTRGTVPTQTSPRTPPTSPPSLPPLGDAALLRAGAVAAADPGAGWHQTSAADGAERPVGTSVYGDCIMVAENPPPRTSWIRDFAPSGRVNRRSDIALRQVLVQAPTSAEAQRTFRQLAEGFTECANHQLVGYAKVRGLGERARVVVLRYPLGGEAVRQRVLLVRTGPVVAVLSAKSDPGGPALLDTGALAKVGGSAIDQVCGAVRSACARPPYRVSLLRPPNDQSSGRFLSVVDLPLVPGLTASWEGTTPTSADPGTSATPCDAGVFARGGAVSVSTRSFSKPNAGRLLSSLGISETVGTFGDSGSAGAAAARLTAGVRACPSQRPAVRVQTSAAFTTRLAAGHVWRLRYRVSAARTLILRVAVVRQGARVAEVVFTTVRGYDVGPRAFLRLAERAGLRLAP